MLGRQFKAEAQHQKRVADFTCIGSAAGRVHVAVVLDQHSRRVVGWSMPASMTPQLAADALWVVVWVL